MKIEVCFFLPSIHACELTQLKGSSIGKKLGSNVDAIFLTDSVIKERYPVKGVLRFQLHNRTCNLFYHYGNANLL